MPRGYTHPGIVPATDKPDFSRSRGIREARGIIEAALEQGWRWRYAGSQGANHLRLIPPNGGVPVGVSATPSDKNYRRQIVRQMRKSGFVWPWPPQGGAKARNGHNQENNVITKPEAVPEVFRTLDAMTRYEISNGGRVLDRLTGKYLSPAENGIVELIDDKGRVREKSVRGLVRAHFGHPPIKNVIPDTSAEIHRSREVLSMLEKDLSNQEENMTAVLEAPVSTNGHSVPDDERWEPVLIEGVIEGYEVNPKAEVLAPKNSRNFERKLLVPGVRSGGHLMVNLKLTNPVGVGQYRQFYLDEIVLEAFEPRPGPEWIPEHKDGDKSNCALDNLRWVQGERFPGKAPRVDLRDTERAREVLSAKVADEPSEAQAIDPPASEQFHDRIEESAVSQEFVEETVAKFVPAEEPLELPEDVDEVNVPVIDRATGEEVQAEKEKPKRRRAKRGTGKKAAAKKAAPARGIQRFRSYKLGNMTVTVDAEGKADLSKAKNLTPQETADLAELLVDVAEANKFFGLK